MKKIVHFIDSGGIYGAESVILNLSREMISDQLYIIPVVGCIVQHRNESVDLYRMARSMGIEAVKIIINNKLFFIDVAKAALCIKKMGIDLIHSHGYKPSVVGFIIHLLTGIPIIATCHLWYMGGERPLKQKIMTRLELFCYRFFPQIVGVSEPIKKTLIKSGVNENRITIIKNGVFVDDYQCPKDYSKITALKKSLGIHDKIPVFVNIARLTEQKAQKNIVLAAGELKKKNIQAVFLIIGEGELRLYLDKMIVENNLQSEVKLLGFRNDVKELLTMADFFILPSYDEGLPISLLEAIASKTPAIVTPVGDIPNFVKHKRNTYFVPVDDVDSIVKSVEWMISHSKECKLMAEEAFSAIQESYSSKKMYNAYKMIYSRMVKNLVF